MAAARSIASIFNANLPAFLKAYCIYVPRNFHQELVFAAAMPVVFTAILGLMRIFRGRASFGILSANFDGTQWFLLMTYLVFPSLSIKIFSTYSCDDKFEGGREYLKADMTIDCESDEHKQYEFLAGFLIALYPLGIPAMYLCCTSNANATLTYHNIFISGLRHISTSY